MKLLSSVAACFLAAQITCGSTTWNVPAEPVGTIKSFDLGEDQIILAHGFLSKFWGGGGQKGQGGGPLGKPPTVTAKSFDVIDPPATGTATVGLVPVTNAPTSCSITLGNTGSFYSIGVTSGGCNLGITPAGVTGLKSTHVDKLTVTALNAAGTGTAIVTANNYALPTMAAQSFSVTPPVPLGPIGSAILVTNIPDTVAITACGSCTGFFQTVLNANKTSVSFNALAPATAIAAGQSFTATVQLTNKAGSTTGNVVVTAAQLVPVVNASTYNVAFNTLAANEDIGQIQAQNNPTSYAVTSCTPGCTFGAAGNFNASAAGRLVIVNKTGLAAGTTYHPTVTASNAKGTSPGVAQNVIVGPNLIPVVAAQAFTIPFASVVNGLDFGTISATNPPFTSYAKGACTFNGTTDCSTFFGVNTLTGHLTIAAAASIAANTTYNLTVSATNGTGTGTATQTVSIGAGSQSPPVVSSLNCIFSTPVTAGVALCPRVPATNPPVTYDMPTSCGGLFQITSDTGRISATAAGAAAAAWNGSVNESTCQPTVRATNTGGNSTATQTLTGFADGSVNAPAATAQHPTLFNPTSGLAAVNIDPNTGAMAAQNQAVYILEGGTIAPGGAAATIVVTSSGVAFQVDGWNVKTVGSYTTVPANPVQVHCIQNCQLFPGRPATDGTVIAQWSAGTGKTYVTRPPWKVAGVDYGVGPPNSTIFLDPLAAGALPAGCSIGGTVVTCSTAGVTVQNFDFASRSLQLVCNAANMTIKNNKFKMAQSMVANELIGGSNACTPVTITQNIIDGNNINNNRSGGQVWLQGNESGGATFTYNWIKSAPQDLYDHENGIFNTRYNLFENAGTVVGNHGDWEQGCCTNTIHTNFNTGLNNVRATTQGWVSTDPIPGVGVSNWIGSNEISYNVGIANDGTANPGDSVSAIIAPLPNSSNNTCSGCANNNQNAVQGTLSISRNYMDATNAFFPIYGSVAQTGSTDTCRIPKVTCSNNTNLVTGNKLAQ